jgi:hypothetical protein
MGSTRIVDPYMGPQRDLMNAYVNWLQPQIGQGIQPYPGQQVPGPTGLQEQAFGLSGGNAPFIQALQEYSQNIMGQPQTDFLGMAGQGFEQMMQPFDPSIAIQAMQPAQDFATQRFWSDFAPQVAERYTAGLGAKDSGAWQRQLTRGYGDMQANIGAQLGQNIFSGWQNQLNRQQQAMAMSPYLQSAPMSIAGQAAGMGTDLTSGMLGAGGQQYGIGAAQAQEAANKWQFQQPWGSPYLPLFQTAFGIPGQDIFVKGAGPSSGSMLAGAALGGLGSAFGGYLGGGGTGGLGGFFGSLF